MTACKLCGQSVDGPAYDARAKGFDPRKHCVLWANNEGILKPCVMVLKQGWPSCHRCGVWKKYVVEGKDKFGREKNVWKRE